ncbi:MAG: RluA family pseudouridine synthase [Bacteroidota bacterium]
MGKETYVQIIYEDNHFIAVNKPAGVLVHGDETGDHTLADAVKGYIKDRYNKPGDVFLGVIHRLDRPVSGVVLFARTSKGLAKMNKLFQERKVAKQYLAIVNKRPEPLEGRITNYLAKDAKKNVARVHKSDRKGAKKSITEYNLKAGLNGYFLLRVNPITGRPHQIRVQLSNHGCPIVGDLKYGYSRPTQDRSICLHCSKLSFEHPIKKVPIVIEADMPEKEYWRFFI